MFKKKWKLLLLCFCFLFALLRFWAAWVSANLWTNHRMAWVVLWKLPSLTIHETLWQSLSQCQRRLTSGTKAPSLQVAPVIWKVPLDSLHTQLAVRPGSLTGLTPVSDPLFHKAIYLQCDNTEAAWAGASEEGSHTKELLGFYTITV